MDAGIQVNNTFTIFTRYILSPGSSDVEKEGKKFSLVITQLSKFLDANQDDKKRLEHLRQISQLSGCFDELILNSLVAKCASDDDPRIRGTFCYMVKNYKRKTFLPYLDSFRNDGNSGVQKQALAAIATLEQTKEVDEPSHIFRAEVFRHVLENLDPEARKIACQFLSQLPASKTFKWRYLEPVVYKTALNDPDPNVSLEAIKATENLYWVGFIQRWGWPVLLYFVLLALAIIFVIPYFTGANPNKLWEAIISSVNSNNIPIAPDQSCGQVYAIAVNHSVGAKKETEALNAPNSPQHPNDEVYASVGTKANSILILDMGEDSKIIDRPGIDFYFYERYYDPGIRLDTVQISVTNEPERGDSTGYRPVFVWGDTAPSNNGDIPSKYFPGNVEKPDFPISGMDLHNGNGIGINIGSDDGKEYRYVVFQTYPANVPSPNAELLAEIDAIERLCPALTPTASPSITATLTFSPSPTTLPPSLTITPSPLPRLTETTAPTVTETLIPVPPITVTPTEEETATTTSTLTPIPPSTTPTPTEAETATHTPTLTPIPPSMTPTLTETDTATNIPPLDLDITLPHTPTLTPKPSETASSTVTLTASATPQLTNTPSATNTKTWTPQHTPIATFTPAFTNTNVPSFTPIKRTRTRTPQPFTLTRTRTKSPVVRPTTPVSNPTQVPPATTIAPPTLTASATLPIPMPSGTIILTKIIVATNVNSTTLLPTLTSFLPSTPMQPQNTPTPDPKSDPVKDIFNLGFVIVVFPISIGTFSYMCVSEIKRQQPIKLKKKITKLPKAVEPHPTNHLKK